MTTCANCGHHSTDEFRFCPECGTRTVGNGVGDPLVGRTVADKYRLREPLGEGSMGKVYLAEHIALRKRIAIKVLHRDLRVGEEALKRFQREGIAAGALSHPNVVQVFDFDRDEDLVFLAMELVEGQNLKTWLEENGPVPPDEAIELARQLLITLVEAHDHGIVHRDLKPENLMLVETGDEPHLKVLDFGLSKLVDRPMDASLQTIAGKVMGTPLYMAPEQWRGEDVDHRVDLYAATLILYELVVGKPPYSGDDLTSVMRSTTSDPPPSLLDTDLREPIPVDLDEVVTRGLAKARDDRFQSAEEMLDALDEVRLDRTAKSRGSSTSGSTSGAARRRSSTTKTSATSSAGRSQSRKSQSRKSQSRQSGIRSRSARSRRAAEPRGNQRGILIGLGAAAGLALVAGAVWWFAAGGGGGSNGPLVSQLAPEQRSQEQSLYAGLLSDARDQLRRRDPAATRVLVDRALRMPCADAEGYLVRGLAYRLVRDDAVAQADLEEALERYPEYAEAAAALGWLHVDRGELEKAAKRFDEALSHDADCVDALTGRAALAFEEGRYDEALKASDRASATENAEAFLWRGKAQLALEDPAAAIESFIAAKRADSNLWQAYAGLGDAYLAQGDPDQAMRQFSDGLALPAVAPELRRRFAEVLLGEERYDRAADVLKPILGDARDGQTMTLAGLIELGRGDRGSAIQRLETAIGRGVDADAARVHAVLANLHLQQNAASKAVRHAKSAVELDESRAEPLVAWGLALFRLGDHAEAARRLEQACEIDGNNQFARYTLGVLYMDYLEDSDGALEQLRIYREVGGTDPRVDGWIERLEK
ncbi:MAG: protein kinase [Planctomycetota bacterium]